MRINKRQPHPWDGKVPFIAVDLDRTLAKFGVWKGPTHIGPPTDMVKTVQQWLREGKSVKVFTTRLQYGGGVKKAIKKWLIQNGLGDLEIINKKDHMMIAIVDDLAVRVEPNTGRIIGNYKNWAWKHYFEE